MIKKYVKGILIIFSFHVSLLYAFDYTALTGPVADAFIGLTGSNEGTTSFNSLLIPSGGKAESMGMAYTGLANDIGFFDFNPAASSWLKNSEAALFHNVWIADSAMETIAGTMRVGHLGLGTQLKIFYVPFTEYNSFGDRVASNYYSESSAAFNIAYHFFPGYKFKGFSIGANIKAAWRSVPDFADDNSGAILKGSGLEQSGLGLMADVGFLMRFNAFKFFVDREPNFSVGLSVINLGVSLTGFGGQKGVMLDSPLPTAISAGVSWHIIKPLTVTLEFRQPFKLQDFTEYQMWSLSTGVQFSFNDYISLMGGLQLKGANPKITLGGEFTFKRLSLNVNYTLDLTSSLNPMNRFSISAKVNLGDRGRGALQQQVDSLYGEGLDLYSQGKLEEAIALWQKALKIDPYFDPLKDAIRSAEEQLQFYQRIYDAQFLD